MERNRYTGEQNNSFTYYLPSLMHSVYRSPPGRFQKVFKELLKFFIGCSSPPGCFHKVLENLPKFFAAYGSPPGCFQRAFKNTPKIFQNLCPKLVKNYKNLFLPAEMFTKSLKILRALSPLPGFDCYQKFLSITLK